MTEIVKWSTQHWDEVLTVVGGVVVVATVIVKLTPTQKDDTVLAKIIKVLAALSIVNPDGSVIGKKDEGSEKSADTKESK